MKSPCRATLAALFLLAACEGGKPHSARAPKPPPVPAQPTPVERDPMSLPERLAFEAEQHPDAVQLVEQTISGFEQAGVTLARKRQVLARMLEAQYCQGGVSGSGVGIALCVFADAAAATRGRDSSRARFDRLIPGRTLITHQRVLLTLTQPANEAAQREIEVIQQRFSHASVSKHAAL